MLVALSYRPRKTQVITSLAGKNSWISLKRLWQRVRKELQNSKTVIVLEFFCIIRLFLPNRGRILPALTEKSKIKSCPYWGLNPQPPNHQSHTLPTVLARNLLEISEVSLLLFHAPLHMLDFIPRINRAWLYKGFNDWHTQQIPCKLNNIA